MQAMPPGGPPVTAFLDELYAVGTLTDDHDTEYDGGHYVTPSILRDNGKKIQHDQDHLPHL